MQGEANMDEGYMLRREQYACLFREMIFSWRQAWNDDNLPFVFPQLHACGSQKNGCTNSACNAGSWTTIRSAQDDVQQTVPMVGMAVAYDQGYKGVHSPHKLPVAHRMALKLRQLVGGESTFEEGPTLIGACLQAFDATTNTSKILVKLNNSDGIFFNGTQGCSDCCNPRGNAGMFDVSMASSYGGEAWILNATMAIDLSGKHIVVTASMGDMDRHGKQLQIFGLRYAAGNMPQCAVKNKMGIPLSPFNAITIAPACALHQAAN
jgi:hypothetical protein